MAPGRVHRRRAFLAGAAGALAATSGCVGDLRNLVGRRPTQQLTLTIATLPAAEDPYAVRIANQLAENLGAAGIDAPVDLMNTDVLYREVLINHEYDLYVARYPSAGDPDELYPLLHSRFGEEAGWQNPFGFSNLALDEQLEAQRDLDQRERRALVGETLEQIVREQPFSVVAFPDWIAGVRTDRFTGWPPGGLSTPADYLALERVDESVDTIQLLLRDARITRNRNPIAAEHRDPSDITGIIYEPLLRELSEWGGPTPWLAREVRWEGDDDGLAATVTLRDTPWHDGEPVTAADVAFTYEFLQDTSLGEFETPVPTPWRRGRVAAVDRAVVLTEDQVRFEFAVGNSDVAQRAFSVPILPEHVWRDRSEAADLGPLDIAGQTTQALVSANDEAVGSGPLLFVDAAEDESIELAVFEDHFLYTGDAEGIPEPFVDGMAFERAAFTVTPSSDAAVQLLEADDADGTADGVGASVVPRIVRNEEVSLTVRRSRDFYHVGFNCRSAPMAAPRFRQAVSQLLDREFLVETSFGGYASASETPLGGQWVPDHLEWDGSASLPFLGERGQVDVDAAKGAFREAGYQYEGGQLVRREPS